MAQINVNLDPCINAAFGGTPPPVGTKIKISIGGTVYNYWGIKVSATDWNGTTKAQHGATVVNIGACLPAIEEFNPEEDWLTIYGEDYYGTEQSKFKCGRPGDRA
jgi:hypothetical protein